MTKTQKPTMQGVFVSHKRVLVAPMNRLQYYEYRGWELPSDEDGSDHGYLVEYLDGGKPNDKRHAGYISWTPEQQFIDGYTEERLHDLPFGDAIRHSKNGHKIARKGWNGKGMWVIYNPGSKGETHAMFEGSVYKNHGVDECEILPHFDMYTVNSEGRRAMLPGWLASQSDMDAEDWYVVIPSKA